MNREKCTECKGRGWHIGECHPREECGACLGTGLLHPQARIAELERALHGMLGAPQATDADVAYAMEVLAATVPIAMSADDLTVDQWRGLAELIANPPPMPTWVQKILDDDTPATETPNG